MNWIVVIIVLAALAVLILLKRSGQISAKDAEVLLKNGALVIDVRSAGEYNSGHLTKAINYPLDSIEVSLPRRVCDKNQALLLHCQSGMRSGMAKRKLNALGYAKAFNLGSYGRAAQIVGSA
jgi:rhodanese-related sulfurtransferase